MKLKLRSDIFFHSISTVDKITFILFFLCLPSYAQYANIVEIDKLPTATEYSAKKWFDVATIGGPQVPFDRDNVVVYSNNITIKNFHLERKGGNPKNIIIIANTVQLGKDNEIILESNASFNPGDFTSKFYNPYSQRPIVDELGGSFIILCRQLIISHESRLRFVGHGRPGYYTSGLGARFYIAAEQIDIDPQVIQKISISYLKAFEEYLQKELIDKKTTSNQDEIVLFFKNMNFDLSREDAGKISDLLNNNRKDDKLIKSIIPYINILLNENIFQYFKLNSNKYVVLSTLFARDLEKGLNGYGESLSPFKPIYPFNTESKFVELEANEKQNIPFVIGASAEMQTFIKTPTQQSPSGFVGGAPSFVTSAGMEQVAGAFGAEALRTLNTEHHKLFSQWAVEWIKYQRDVALQAQALGDRVTLFKALRAVAEMPRYQLDVTYSRDYASVNTQMLSLLTKAKNLISEKQLIMEAPLAGTPATVFSQGIPARYFQPPTEVLLTGVRSGKKWDYGIIEDVNTPERLKRFRLQGELKADPLVAALVTQKLQNEFSSTLQPGLLPNIKYGIEGVTGDGIKSFKATVNGSVVNFMLDIEPESVGPVMLRLASTGLPYFLKWTVPGDPEQNGQLGPLQLRLNRRTGGQVHMEGLKISNEETEGSAKVTYVRTSKGRILPVKEIVVEAGKSVSLTGLSLNTGEYLVNVPDMGIQYDDGRFERAITRFLVLDGNAVIDEVVISNRIPATITPSGTDLTFQVRNVEVALALVNPESKVAKPFADGWLAPDKSQGSAMRARIPRLAILSNTYRITGKVHFSDGGSASLKPTDYTTPVISITTDQINLPQPTK